MPSWIEKRMPGCSHVWGAVSENRKRTLAGIGPEDSAAYMKLFDFGRGSDSGL